MREQLLLTAWTAAAPWILRQLAHAGSESAVLAPLGARTAPAVFLVRRMSHSPATGDRALAAMLAGWIDAPKHSGLLMDLLAIEREHWNRDFIESNQVAEHIMFAATRWAEHPARPDGRLRDAGIQALAAMLDDVSFGGAKWNCANWAAGNLWAATEGKHPALARLAAAPPQTLD